MRGFVVDYDLGITHTVSLLLLEPNPRLVGDEDEDSSDDRPRDTADDFSS